MYSQRQNVRQTISNLRTHSSAARTPRRTRTYTAAKTEAGMVRAAPHGGAREGASSSITTAAAKSRSNDRDRSEMGAVKSLLLATVPTPRRLPVLVRLVGSFVRIRL